MGIDQAPHLEFAREIVRSFNYRYNTNVLVEPQMKAAEVQKVLGIDGKEKMGKSLNNQIELAATPEETRQRVMMMVTDPHRIKRTDPGNPDICNVFTLHKVFTSQRRRGNDQHRMPPGRHRLCGLQETSCREFKQNARTLPRQTRQKSQRSQTWFQPCLLTAQTAPGPLPKRQCRKFGQQCNYPNHIYGFETLLPHLTRKYARPNPESHIRQSHC